MEEELSEKEFLALDDENKWRYIKDLLSKIEELEIMADKNCLECRKYLITPTDLNLRYFMEDWRECRKDCEESGRCSYENQVDMCELQYQIINHLTNEMITLRNRQNGLTEFILERGEGKDILKNLMKQMEESEKREKRSEDIYR